MGQSEAEPTGNETLLRARLRPLGMAWQPLTGRGIAALGQASFFRLLTLQVGFGILLGWVVSHCTWRTLVPTWTQALSELPDQAGIQNGSLIWPQEPPRRLSQTPWFDLVVFPATYSGNPFGKASDIQIALHPTFFRIHSLLGHSDFPYPDWLHFPLGRIEARAWWSAWKDLGRGVVAIGVAGAMIPLWWLLALIYSPVAWFLGRFFEKFFSIITAWRLGTAALLMASLVLAGGLIAYSHRWIPFPALAGALLLHFLFGWIWSVWGILHCPASPVPGNTRRETRRPPPRTRKASKKSSNPFR